MGRGFFLARKFGFLRNVRRSGTWHNFPMNTLLPNFPRVPLWMVLLAAMGSCSSEDVRSLPHKSGMVAFEEIGVSGGDNAWSEEYHPFVGATPIDVDGDGTMEIFVGGGEGYDDRLYTYRSGMLIDVVAGTGLSDRKATHGATSIDMDDDGDTDLLLARRDGVFLYLNDGGFFTRRRLPVTLPSEAVPFNVAVGDIDRDGDGDLYVSAFVDLAHFRSATFNDPQHAKTNVLLRNDGGLAFTDITEASGTASSQNTFLASFIDLDGDGWLDLVVAQNTGQVEFFENKRDGSFAPREVRTGWGFWMGLAPGDIDQDGDPDLFFTNSGTSIPGWLLEMIGDGRADQPRNYGWILLRNDGDFDFRDVTAEYQLDNHGFGWGALFEDLTLDGELELLVAQNYIKWPFHRISKLPGKTFVQVDGAFYDVPDLGLANRAFAQSPLILDFSGDGRPDVFWVNKEGPGRALVNRSTHNFLALRFADAVSSIGARAVVITADGDSYTRVVYNNIGMSIDPSTTLTFGLGTRTRLRQARITWPDGTRKVLDNPPVNRTLEIRR